MARGFVLSLLFAGLVLLLGDAPGRYYASAQAVAANRSSVIVDGSQTENFLTDLLEQILDQAVHAPIPDAIGPLVTLAENADTIAIAALEIAAGKRDRELKQEWLKAGSDAERNAIERKEKAIEQLKAKLNEIKAKREAEEKKKQEDGWDPFHGRFTAGEPVVPPGTFTFSLVVDPLDPADLPGDDPKGPMVAMVKPNFAGGDTVFVPATSGTLTVQLDATPDPSLFLVQLDDFSLTVDSFDFATSVSTGENHGQLNPHGSPPIGEYHAFTGQFDVRFEGMYTNSLYDDSRPILFFAQAFGGLRSGVGEALVGADDPMLVPLPPALAPLNQPSLMGAHVIHYDNPTSTVTFLENTTLVPNADIAMARNAAGEYIVDPAVDTAIGSRLIIDPMPALGETSPGVWTFADTAFRVNDGTTDTLSGVLRNVRLDTLQVNFSAAVEIADASSTGVVSEFAAALGEKRLNLSSAPGAVDLLAATGNLGQTESVPMPVLFHLDAGPPPGAPLLGTVTDNFDGTAHMTWTNPSQTPAQFLGVSYDVYGEQFVPRGYLGTIWFPFLPTAAEGDLDLFYSGAYHAWITNQYADASWYPCPNPWTGILYGGTPHQPLDVSVEDLGGGNVRLHWDPEIFGTWLWEIIVYQVDPVDPLTGSFIPVDGPSGTALWHFIDYGGAAYDAGKADFFAGTADFALPADGAYWVFIRGAGWLPPYPVGAYAMAFISVGP